MSTRRHDWSQRWLSIADEAQARARRAFGAAPSAPIGGNLQLSDLEPRILFSATPIDAGSMPGGDQAAMVVEVEALETESDFESIDTLTEQAAAQQSPREIVLIDAAVPEIQQLLDDLHASERDLEVYVLDGDSDGVDQISEILDSRNDVDSLHIVSHAEDGAVKLGNIWLNDTNVVGYAGQIAAWQDALTAEADILFYGCDLTASEGGRTLVDSISALTNADVAASTDDTGHEQFHGNWELEYSVGAIESQVAFSAELQQTWQAKLATITVDTFDDVVDGGDGFMSLREAVMQANAVGGETILLSQGTYTLSLGAAGEDGAAGGDLDITNDVTIIGAGADTTTINGGGVDRVFEVLTATGQLTLKDVSVTGGNVTGDGGGISITDAASQLALQRVHVTGNLAANGAGIANNGIASLTDVWIDSNGNGSTINGGGFANDGEATLNRVTISGNQADSGGGIYDQSSATSLSLSDVTVSGNTAFASGGGLYERNTASIVNSSFVLNTAFSGGGIRTQVGNVSVQNTIIATNIAPANADVEGTFSSQGNNLIGDGTGTSDFTDGTNGDQVGTTVSPIDPMIDLSLNTNGGFVPTHAIVSGSPAINAGKNIDATPVDARGFARIDGLADIGAFESNAVLLDKVYWSDEGTGRIQRSDLNGDNVEDLVTGLGSAGQLGLFVDSSAGKIYWGEENNGVIRSANLDGSGVMNVVAGISDMREITVDTVNQKVYWTEDGFLSNKIRRAGLDGTGIEDLITTGLDDPGGIELDIAAGKMYWVDTAANKIQRAGLAGGPVEDLVDFTDGIERPRRLKLDLSAGKMYWTNDGFISNKIYWANLDGTAVQSRVSSGLNSPAGIDLDLNAGKIYWTDYGNDKIQMSNLDGTQVQDVIFNGLSIPVGLALGGSEFQSSVETSLWFSTSSNVATSGATGLGSWNDDEVIKFGGPNLTLQPTGTNGTFSSVFDLDQFVGDGVANIDGMHYVTRNLTIGGANAINLQAGDLLLSTTRDESFHGGTVNVLDEDIFLFRPDQVGNYTSGTFSLVLHDLSSLADPDLNLTDLKPFSLVERDTAVGDTTLVAGDFIFRPSSTVGEFNDIYVFHTVDVGDGTTAGTADKLIEGDDLGITEALSGLELIEIETSVGGQTLSSGEILVAVEQPDSGIGSTPISVDSHDVFRLQLSATTLVAGTAGADAALLFDGTSVNLNQTQESLDALTLVQPEGFVNTPAIITNQSMSVDENSTVATSVGKVAVTDTDPEFGYSRLYWVDVATDEVRRINLNGSDNQVLASQPDGTDATGTRGVAVDAANGKIYWSNNNSNGIWQADTDGGNPTPLITGLNAPQGIAVDSVSGKIFWIENATSEIWSADLDGANAAMLINGLTQPRDLSIDPVAGKVYWTDDGSNQINRADLNGGNVQTVISGVTDPWGIELDLNEQKIYWSEPGSNEIFRANMVIGATPELVVTGAMEARDLTLDIVNRVIYWTAAATDEIAAASYDGSPLPAVSSTGNWPTAIAIGPDTSDLNFAITSGNTGGTFAIDSITGEITVANGGLLDFETTSVFNLDVEVTDSLGLTDTATITINVNDLNEAPTANNTPGNVTYTATDPPVYVDSGITISDPDDTHLVGASVRIVVGFTASEDNLSFTPETGIVGNYDSGTGILSFTGSATLAAYQNVLQSVTYQNTNPTPNTANRWINYELNDGDLSAAGGMRTIEVGAPANTLPVANGGGPYTIREGDDLLVDASASSDDGSIVEYRWDLNNDLDYSDFISVSVTPTIDWATLASFGLNDGDVGGTNYTIGLQVEDDLGGTHETTTTVTINDSRPELFASGSSVTMTGTTYTLNLSSSDDGNDAIVDWIIDWGDGTVEQLGFNASSWNHAYAAEGRYDILVAAIDEDGTHLQNNLLVTGYNSSTTYTFDSNTGEVVGSFSRSGQDVNIEVGPDGKLYVTSFGGTVERFLADGTPDGNFASSGLSQADGLAFGPDGDLYVASFNTDSVMRYEGATGAYVGTFTSGGSLSGASNLTFGPDGHLYASSWNNGRIEKFDGTTGVSMGTFASGLSNPEALVFGPDGNLYVSSRAANEVVKLNGTTGAEIGTYSDANLNNPYGLAFAPDGSLYVAGFESDNIVQFDANSGVYLGEFANSTPSGLDAPSYLHFLPDQQVTVFDTAVYLAPVQDTWLNNGATGLNYGGSPSIVVDQSGGSLGYGRALLQFDLSNIPVGATIVSAGLNLEATANTGAFNLNVYEVTEGWNEGGSDAAAGEANWNDRKPLTGWTTTGGTVDAGTVVDTLNTTATGQHSWDVTSLVDAWYLGSKVNNGLMIASPDPGTKTVTYDSREGATAPELQVFYTLANSPPTDINPISFAVDENTNTTSGYNLGTLTASDPDTGESFTYSIVGGADQFKFTIGGGGDQLILTDGVLDNEAQDSYSVIVRVTDSALQTHDELITVSVNDLNDSNPEVDPGQSFDVSEFAPIGTSLGLVTASDADDGTIFSNWTITGGNGDGIFFIDSGIGELQVVNNANLNHEVNDSYTLTITVSDGTNASVGQTVNINVLDENETPTNITLDSNTVDENTAGAVIGNVATADVDDGDTHSYTISDSRFEVVAGQLKLKAGAYLDFESEPTVDVTITALDQGGATIDKLFTINVINLTEAGVTNFVPGPQNVLEDDFLVFSAFTGNAITVDDGTTADPVLRSTLSVTGGVLDLGTTSGLTSVSGDGTAKVTITGLENAINAALDGLIYTPADDYNGPANLQVSTDLQSDLQGRYSFENPGFLGEDSSPSGANDGITWGSPISTFDATRGGNVITLNGVNQNVVLPGNRFGTPTDLTLAGWVNVAAANNQEVISIGSSIALRLNDINNGVGVTGFYHDGSSWQHTDSGQFIGNDGWHHVAFAFDDATDTQVIYLDGVAMGTTNHAASINWAHLSDTTIGSHANGTGYWLQGMLDDVRIYDRALSGSEIQALATDSTSQTRSVAITVDPDNDLPVGLPAITGIEQEDETLTADVTGITDADSTGTFGYQWLRNGGVISGATSDSYVLGDDDVDQVISVEVTYVDGDGTLEGPLESDPTGLIGNVNDLPVGAVDVTGIVAEDETLMASHSLTDDDGMGTVSYHWYRDGVDIVGATGNAYTLTDDDVGAVITVAASYTDGHGFDESVLSSPTAAVANVNDDPTVLNPIADQFTAQNDLFTFQFAVDVFEDIDGDTLTYSATLADSSPLPTWLSFDAANRSFAGTPGAADVGLITVRLIADDGNLGTAFSDFVLTVTNINNPPTDITLDNLSVDETTPGAVIGKLSVADADFGDTHSFIVDDARFEVVAGQLKLKPTETVDYEAEPFLTVMITATDQAGASIAESFTIAVSDINEAPTAGSETFTVTVGQTLVVPSAGVLIGDTDPDGDALTAVLLAGPANGVLTLQPNGSFDYTPNAGFTGVDSFVYQASDGSLVSHSAFVTITVEPAVGPPPPPPTDGDGDDDSDPLPPPPPPVDPPPEEPPPPPEETVPDTSTTPTTKPSQSQPPAGVIPVAPIEDPVPTVFASQEVSEDVAADEKDSKQKQEKLSRDKDNDGLRSRAGNIYRLAANDAQIQAFDALRNDVEDWGFQRLSVGVAVSTSLSFSVGYVFWTVRAGWLASALMTSMPVWRSIDPLPVLEYLDGEDPADDESLQSIVNQHEVELQNKDNETN